MVSVNTCPHCGKDKRNLDEIVKELKNELDERLGWGDNEISYNDEREKLIALLELNEIKTDSLTIHEIKQIIQLIDRYWEQIDDFESYQTEDTSQDIDIDAVKGDLIASQKEIHKLLSGLADKLSQVYTLD